MNHNGYLAISGHQPWGSGGCGASAGAAIHASLQEQEQVLLSKLNRDSEFAFNLKHKFAYELCGSN